MKIRTTIGIAIALVIVVVTETVASNANSNLVATAIVIVAVAVLVLVCVQGLNSFKGWVLNETMMHVDPQCNPKLDTTAYRIRLKHDPTFRTAQSIQLTPHQIHTESHKSACT